MGRKLSKTEQRLQNLRRKAGYKMVLPTIAEYRSMSKKAKQFYANQARRIATINSDRHHNKVWKSVKEAGVFNKLTKVNYSKKNKNIAYGVDNLKTLASETLSITERSGKTKYREYLDDHWRKTHRKSNKTQQSFVHEKIGAFGLTKKERAKNAKLLTMSQLINQPAKSVDYTNVNSQQLVEEINAIDYYKPVEKNGVTIGYLDSTGGVHEFVNMPGKYRAFVSEIMKNMGVIK